MISDVGCDLQRNGFTTFNFYSFILFFFYSFIPSFFYLFSPAFLLFFPFSAAFLFAFCCLAFFSLVHLSTWEGGLAWEGGLWRVGQRFQFWFSSTRSHLYETEPSYLKSYLKSTEHVAHDQHCS